MEIHKARSVLPPFSRLRLADSLLQITVTGPAVAGGTVSLGVAGTFNEDGTLAYVCGADGKASI